MSAIMCSGTMDPKILKLLKNMIETAIFCFRSKFDVDSKFHTVQSSSINIYGPKHVEKPMAWPLYTGKLSIFAHIFLINLE